MYKTVSDFPVGMIFSKREKCIDEKLELYELSTWKKISNTHIQNVGTSELREI